MKDQFIHYFVTLKHVYKYYSCEIIGSSYSILIETSFGILKNRGKPIFGEQFW